MKHALILFIVVITTCALFPGKGWTGGKHFSGGYGHGHFGGGQFSSGSHHFGGSGPYTNYGSPAFRSPGFGHSPYRPYPPYFSSQHSFRRDTPFFLPGLSSQRFVYRQRFGPAGSPPAGAPGPTPYASATPPKAPTSFYCVEHAFRYFDQKAFFGHLNFAHKVPLKHAAAHCQQVENGLIFSGD